MSRESKDLWVNAVVAGSWLIFVLDVLIFRHGTPRVIDLVTCLFGVIAIASITTWRKRRERLIVLTAAAFLIAYSAKVVEWIIEGSSMPDFFGDTFMKRLWSFYEGSYFVLEHGFRDGQIATGLIFFFSDIVMPLLQIGLIVVLCSPAQASLQRTGDDSIV